MAKIDVTKIKGYEEMSDSDKIKALLGYEVETDLSGYVSKTQFDKAASDLATAKKQLKERMSEDEIARQKDKEEREAMAKELEELKLERDISKNKAEFLALGYEDKLAGETALALVKGDFKTVFGNQKKHLETFEQGVKSKALDATPKPGSISNENNKKTKEDLRKMSPEERYQFSVEHADEYASIYGESSQE